MADKEIHQVQSDSGVGSGLFAAGILIAVLVALIMIFFAGVFDFQGSKDVNVDIDPPKIQTPDTDGKR